MPILKIRPSNLDGTLSYRDTFSNAAFAQANTDVTNINITSDTYGNSTYYPVITV